MEEHYRYIIHSMFYRNELMNFTKETNIMVIVHICTVSNE